MSGRLGSLSTEHELMILPRWRAIMRCATAPLTNNSLSMLVLVLVMRAVRPVRPTTFEGVPF